MSATCPICSGAVPDGAPREAHTALCAAVVAEGAERDRKKLEEYEQEYILPCFKWAEQIGFDLPEAVNSNPGKNCVRLLVEHLCDRVNGANLLRMHTESELARAILARDVMHATLTLAQDSATKSVAKIRVLDARRAVPPDAAMVAALTEIRQLVAAMDEPHQDYGNVGRYVEKIDDVAARALGQKVEEDGC